MDAEASTYTVDAAAVEPVLSALAEAFTVAEDDRAEVQRVWLDTFDWRLYRAGMTLEQTNAPEAVTLRLVGRHGERIAEQPGRMEPPGRIEQLPAGPVRERIAGPVDIRALLSMASVSGRERRVRLLDAEEKTRVRLVIEHSDQLGPLPRALPVRLVVAPLRGYGAAGRRVAGAIEAAAGVSARTEPLLELVLDGTDRQPGAYTGKVDVPLTGDLPADTGVARILLHLLDTFEANLEGTISDLDTEFLHDLRVAVRRTRSALKLLGDALPGLPSAEYAAEFKWLGDLTTPTRDLDVHQLELVPMERALVVAEPADLEPFARQLARRRRVEYRRLVRGLRSARVTRLRESWRERLVAIRDEPMADRLLEDLARERIGRAYRRLVKKGAAIDDTSPAGDLHNLRKRGKELRYLIEFFAALYDRDQLRGVVGDLKRLQDCLGRFQDGSVQTAALRTFAEELAESDGAPAATLLAMGELTAYLHRRQVSAREEFATRFARFAGPKNARRILVPEGEAAA